MATIYRSNEHIAELKLTVRGAATILLFDPNEVEGLQALCISIGQNQRGPTESIFNLLTHERDIDLIGARNRLADIRIRNWQDVAASEFANDPVQEIVAALGLTAAVWRSQGEDVSDLVLILCACDPHAKPEPVMHLEGENPGWILYKGSVRATLFVSAFTAGGFVVGIFTRGIGVERRARNVVEDLRTKQLERIPRVKVLPRIDQLKPSDIANKCGVILFLHGLLSTDLGTFDVLTDVLRDQGLTEDDFLFIGWPHNTLTRIEFNAEELCRLIEYLWGKITENPLRLAFVCHSRGGLLARYAAATLFQRDLERWKAIIGGCVTFGTPHTGTDLADAPDNLIASFIAAAAWKESGRLAALSDVLWIRKANRVLEGEEDLRTISGKRPDGRDPFQKTLSDRERSADIKHPRMLQVLTVGGRIGEPSKWYHDIAGRVFGEGTEHDLAVPVDSAIPGSVHRFSAVHPPIECDHFDYFADAQRASVQYAEVADYLKYALDYEGCARRSTR